MAREDDGKTRKDAACEQHHTHSPRTGNDTHRHALGLSPISLFLSSATAQQNHKEHKMHLLRRHTYQGAKEERQRRKGGGDQRQGTRCHRPNTHLVRLHRLHEQLVLGLGPAARGRCSHRGREGGARVGRRGGRRGSARAEQERSHEESAERLSRQDPKTPNGFPDNARSHLIRGFWACSRDWRSQGDCSPRSSRLFLPWGQGGQGAGWGDRMVVCFISFSWLLSCC